MSSQEVVTVRKVNFVFPGKVKSEFGLSEEQKKQDVNISGTVRIEQSNVFSLSYIRTEADKILDTASSELKVSREILLEACLATLLSNGSARNKMNSIILALLDGTVAKSTKYSSEGDGVVDLSVIFRELESKAKDVYNGIKTSKNTANAGKLFMRAFANQSYTYIVKANEYNISKLLKIASKTSVTNSKLAMLCNPAFPDIEEISKADAIGFLKIMANYMRRSRSGKASKDVNGDEINKKDIFLSLAARLYITHPEAGMLNNAEIDKMWEEGKLPNESDIDLASKFYYGQNLITLAAGLDMKSKFGPSVEPVATTSKSKPGKTKD